MTTAKALYGEGLTYISLTDKMIVLFPKSFIRYMKNPPNDFSLDVYFLVIAAIKKYKIIEHKVNWNARKYGEAKGGGSIKAKFNLTIQTLKRIHQLKNSNIK